MAPSSEGRFDFRVGATNVQRFGEIVPEAVREFRQRPAMSRQHLDVILRDETRLAVQGAF